MKNLENAVYSYFTNSDIQDYEAAAKDQGLNSFDSIVQECISNAQDFSTDSENIIEDAIEQVDAAISEFI